MFEDLIRRLSLLLNHFEITFVPESFSFTTEAKNLYLSNEPDRLAQEYTQLLSSLLTDQLTDTHRFVEVPYIRTIFLNTSVCPVIRCAILNEQSKQWYGNDNSVAAFDFVREYNLGLFKDCSVFLDIGAHQFLWSIFYSKVGSEVDLFEPSIINCCIGLFNLFINDSLGNVNINGCALISSQDPNSAEKASFLIDFVKSPPVAARISDFLVKTYDFVKVDIEGYEYEMLSDKDFVSVLKKSIYAHFELHLGHLEKRGVSVGDSVNLLKKCNFKGVEYYTLQDMYEFLELVNPVNNFPAFILSGRFS